jgi:hypothetical protein
MLRSAERIPAVFVPPPKKRSCPNSRLVLRRRDRGCSQPRIHYYEYKNDCTWRSFARRWLLLVEPGFCTGRYGRNHDKRCIHGIRSRLRDNGRQKRSWHQPVALFRNQTDDDCRRDWRPSCNRPHFARQSALNPVRGFRRPAGSVASYCAAGGNGDYCSNKRPCRDRTANQYHHDNNPSSHT